MNDISNLFVDSCFRCERPLTRIEIVKANAAAFCYQCAHYFSGFSTGDPWPSRSVRWLLPTIEDVEQLTSEFMDTISSAADERPLQKFFERNPSFLVQIFRYGHGRWVFPQPRLGSEHIPDFMVCGLDSSGPHWHLIELESPRISVLRKDGQPRQEFIHARQQIDDWRIWLRKNSQYAQNELGYIGLDADFSAVIVMGRREDLAPEHRERYRELSRDRIEVMSYERLFEQVTRSARGFRESFDRVLKATPISS